MSVNIGIYGGLGPLASAKFVETIYKNNLSLVSTEQELPTVILYSDPSMPDRSAGLLDNRHDFLLSKLKNGLEFLVQLGADKIVICCFTLHHLLPHLSSHMQERIISLPSVLMRMLADSSDKYLLLRTKGSRHLKIFENNSDWEKSRSNVVLLDNTDENIIHDIIYDIKKYGIKPVHLEQIEMFMIKYNATKWAVGCTEFHLLASKLYEENPVKAMQCIADPLLAIALDINKISEVSL